MTGMTPERLAEIKARTPGTPDWQIHDDRWGLLAEVERLRGGVEDTRQSLWEAWVEGGDISMIDATRNDLAALLNPTEAEDDE